MSDSIFHPDFKAMPYGWEAWRPTPEGAEGPLPSRTDIAIVGAGYAGLSTAIELADNGVAVTVIEANEPTTARRADALMPPRSPRFP
jgi:NADPH-dependent 2,4-dienoyl-CoA reductase/sulfur reductase-like enzyme